MLKVNNIDTFYGSLQVLWGISIEIATGEIVAIIGANGSGKSSLLNTISGKILLPSETWEIPRDTIRKGSNLEISLPSKRTLPLEG